jgi:type II secretory pathway predicted ATPase ExeA
MSIEPNFRKCSNERIFPRSFFYSNLRIQESLTAIRYGVEARRGLIVVMGASGSGKTTLLSKAVADMPPHVFCLAMSGAALQFSDVLRQLNDTESADNDESALVRNCQSLLRTRLSHNELTALAIDDAHALPERTLRSLIHNFLGGSAESPDGALLQLILAGNHSLKHKLAQAALIPLRRRRPVVCEVAPLTSQEVGTYIQEGLRSAERPIDLFDSRALKRIALLSRGNPRAIERLCEHALRLNGGIGLVTAEKIDAAAHSLNLRVDAA